MFLRFVASADPRLNRVVQGREFERLDWDDDLIAIGVRMMQ